MRKLSLVLLGKMSQLERRGKTVLQQVPLMLVWLLVFTLALLSSTRATAQQTKKTLTNADVVSMVKAGLTESTIILVIQHSPNSFNTSPQALIELKSKGVSQKILDAMLTASNEGGASTSEGAVRGRAQAAPNPPAKEPPFSKEFLESCRLAFEAIERFDGRRTETRLLDAEKAVADCKRKPRTQDEESARRVLSDLLSISKYSSLDETHRDVLRTLASVAKWEQARDSIKRGVKDLGAFLEAEGALACWMEAYVYFGLGPELTHDLKFRGIQKGICEEISEKNRKQSVTVPAGTRLLVRMIDLIDSEVNHSGEIFRASLDAPLVVDNEIVVPTGTDVYLKLVGRTELQLELVRMQFQSQGQHPCQDKSRTLLDESPRQSLRVGRESLL